MKLYKSLAVGVIALTSFATAAQNTYSGYFLENNLYRHDLNPAFGNEYNYVSMPVLGNLNFAVAGNLNLKDILYNVNGQTVTFMNPNISASEVMGNLSDKNQLTFGLNLKLLTAGFKAFGGYNTIEISARTNLEANLPKAVFSFLKEGVTNRDYDISDLRARTQAYAEIALGHSHKLNDKLTIGAKMKFLLGMANVDANLKSAHLNLQDDKWAITTNAEIQASVKGLTYKTSESNRIDPSTNRPYEYVSDMDIDGTGMNGFGLAFDLGAVYKINEDWQVSASLLDLGFISWNNNMVASTKGAQSFVSDAYTFNADEDAPNSFESEWDLMRDDLSKLYELSDLGNKGSRSTALAATLNIGGEYTLPVYRKLKFGVLNTTRFAGVFTTTNFRFSANVQPIKAISAGINLSAGTYGVGFGWMLNICPKGFNLFLGMDSMLGKLAKQGIPLSSNAAFNMGINFPF